MPPSLSVSVGVPPVVTTLTASLMIASVSVMVAPAASSPLAGVSAAAVTVGAVVSICGPVNVTPVSDRLAALPAPSVMVAAVEIDRRHRQRRGVLTGRHRVVEHQRRRRRFRRVVGRRAAVVERQRRRAARDDVTASLRLRVSVTTVAGGQLAACGWPPPPSPSAVAVSICNGPVSVSPRR